VTPTQAYLHDILSAIFGPPPGVGERLRFVDFTSTLERIAEEGTSFLFAGDVARALCETAPQVTTADLAGYRVITRRPVSTTFRGYEFASNPPPSSGGVLIAYGLRLLEKRGRFEAQDVLETMRGQDAVRDRLFRSQLYRGGLARRLVEAPSMTTHISVVDAEGNAASLSCSLGSGAGVVVPGTGIHLNNMLGEHDLAGVQRPGTRLTSMMAPSICFDQGRTRLVVGSAGSARLRGAIMQVVVNVLARGLDVRAAVDAPRVHLDEGLVHAEKGAEVRGLESEGLVEWKAQNLFFGGANAVEVLPVGSLAAAGDPRRGGAAVVVE
jgi:gamma-glutamyltranspeptidase/glutathione hydrolase